MTTPKEILKKIQDEKIQMIELKFIDKATQSSPMLQETGSYASSMCIPVP